VPTSSSLYQIRRADIPRAGRAEAPAEPKSRAGLARILERQNILQISQVFVPWTLHSNPSGFAFQGFSRPDLGLFDFNWSYLRRHAPVKKQTQYANRAKAFALHQFRSRHFPRVSTSKPSRWTGALDIITLYLCIAGRSPFGRPFRANSLCVSFPGAKARGLFCFHPSGD
jgi:hypothetical protein